MDTTMKKPRRRPNFSFEELTVITEEVSRNKAVLSGKFSDAISAERKNKIWRSITTNVNAVSATERNAEEVKKKWTDWSSSVKTKAAKIKTERLRTGGGSSQAGTLTPLEERVIGIIGKTATEGVQGGIETLVDPNEYKLMCREDPDDLHFDETEGIVDLDKDNPTDMHAQHMPSQEPGSGLCRPNTPVISTQKSASATIHSVTLPISTQDASAIRPSRSQSIVKKPPKKRPPNTCTVQSDEDRKDETHSIVQIEKERLGLEKERLELEKRRFQLEEQRHGIEMTFLNRITESLEAISRERQTSYESGNTQSNTRNPTLACSSQGHYSSSYDEGDYSYSNI